jgi:Putative Actinobacterial Holin-X, holin superfamily III
MAHSAPVHPLIETAGPAQTSVGTLVKSATADLSTLIRGEIELAKAEVGTSVKRGGVGIAAFAVAGVMAAFAGFFFFIMVAELLTWAGLPRWISYLIVFAFLLLLAGVAGLVGLRFLKRIEKPEKTLETLHDLPDVMRRQAPGRREHDLPTVRNGHVERADPHARLS